MSITHRLGFTLSTGYGHPSENSPIMAPARGGDTLGTHMPFADSSPALRVDGSNMLVQPGQGRKARKDQGLGKYFSIVSWHAEVLGQVTATL